jgi:hypothetical protein
MLHDFINIYRSLISTHTRKIAVTTDYAQIIRIRATEITEARNFYEL